MHDSPGPDPQIPTTYEDVVPETCLRIVDEAVVSWLSHLKLRNQTPKVVTVWQSRQFAQQHEVHKDKDKPVKQAWPLPVVSVAMSGITPALDRRVVGQISHLGAASEVTVSAQVLATGDGLLSTFTGKLGWWPIVPGSLTITDGTQEVTDDGNGALVGDIDASGVNIIDYSTGRYFVSFAAAVADQAQVTATFRVWDSRMYAKDDRSEVYVLPFPIPYDLTYQVDIWTKTQQDMQWLRSSLLSRFPYADETFLRATFGGYGDKVIPLRLDRVDDTTDLEPDEGHRQLRNTVTFTAKAWIFQVPIQIKTIQSINVAILDASSDEEKWNGVCSNCQDGSAFMDWYGDDSHYTFSGTVPAVLQSVQESPDFTPPDRAIALFGWVDGTLTQTGP